MKYKRIIIGFISVVLILVVGIIVTRYDKEDKLNGETDDTTVEKNVETVNDEENDMASISKEDYSNSSYYDSDSSSTDEAMVTLHKEEYSSLSSSQNQSE